MADIVVTASAVIMVAGGVKREGVAGGTITQGQPLYRNSANQMVPAQGDAAATDAVEGVALSAASAGQPVDFQYEGDLTFNAVLLAGMPYVLSAAAAGGICPVADLTVGEFGTLIGIAKSTTVMRLALATSSAAVAV